MSLVLLKIEEYEVKERFSLRKILKDIELVEEQDKIDYYMLNRLDLGKELNISKEYIEQEFGLDYFFEHLENQVKKIKNSYVLARYYKVLWFFRNKMLNIKRVENHRTGFIENIILSYEEKKIKDNYLIEDLLGEALNQCKKNEPLEEKTFKKLIERGKEHKSSISIFDIIKNYNKTKAMTEKAIELVGEEWKEFLKEKENPNEFLDHLKILLEYYENDSIKINNLLENIVKYFYDFKGIAIQGNIFVNKLLTNNLMKKLIKNKKIDLSLIDKLKRISLEMGKNIKFGSIETGIQVSKEEMEKIFRMFILNTEEKSIRMLLYEYLEVYEIIKNQTIENQSEFSFINLFPPIIYDGKGRMIAQPKTETEKSKLDFAQWSPLHFMYFKRQLETIFKEFSINEKYFDKKIDVSLYFDETDKLITKKAIYNYFKGDYIIFLHLMLPRIENILRNFLEKQGESILGRIKKDGFKYKILGDILEDPKIRYIFTEETLEYFKLVLNNDLGLNIRNNLSHGIISIGECNENKSNIVFHILLFLIYM